jgi:hypothetical protein
MSGAGADELWPEGGSGGAEAMAGLLQHLVRDSNTEAHGREVARRAVHLCPSNEFSWGR